MKLYVANTTQQIQHFSYRLPESKQVRVQVIPIGNQVALSGDLTTKDIEYVVEQHAKYGMVRADEVDRTRSFIGTCYSVDKPVNMNKVRSALERNNIVLIEQGRQIRAEAGMAVHDAAEKAINPRQGALKAMEFSVEEVPSKDGKDTEVNETLRVSRDEEPTKGPTRRPPQRRAG